MIPNFKIKASLRNALGSADSRRVRKSGQLPAVIRVKNENNLNIVIDSKDFEHQYFKGNILTSIVEIDLDNKKISAIPHKVELDPVTDRPIHVDFLPFSKDSKVKVQTKIKFINQDKSPGLKKGGFLHVVLRKVAVLCNSNSIPEFIEIDISSARVGSKIKSENLKLPSGVEIAKKNSFIIASIIGRGSKEDEDKASTVAEGVAGNTSSSTSSPASGSKSPASKVGDKKETEKKPAAKK